MGQSVTSLHVTAVDGAEMSAAEEDEEDEEGFCLNVLLSMLELDALCGCVQLLQ